MEYDTIDVTLAGVALVGLLLVLMIVLLVVDAARRR